MADRRKDKENYQHLAIYADRKLVRRFKAVVAYFELDVSAAGEEAILKWVKQKEAEQQKDLEG